MIVTRSTIGPAIRLGCGHTFHVSCVKQKLSRRWPGARITFGFLTCPLCHTLMDHPALFAAMVMIMS